MIVDVSIARRRLDAGALSVPCEIGRGGACTAAEKREGDGRTPIGTWPIRAAILRPDRGFAPPPRLPWRWMRRRDGWCDAPRDPAYNRPVQLPYPASAETMWRDDRVYDVVVVLGHNDAPPMPECGSAIFLHVANGRATEGCVAISTGDFAKLLPNLAVGDLLRVA